MKIFSAQFEKSTVKSNQFFFSDFPEYVFAGRSNVGKSSLINFITNRKKLAKVSSHPGRTQFINYFLINHQWYLIDLPGYGYSIIKNRKKETQKLITDYISFFKKNLTCLFLLIDCRISVQKIDIDFMKKLKAFGIHFCIIFTKIDKLNQKTLNQNIFLCQKKIEKQIFSIPKYFKVSVKEKSGKDKIIHLIEKFNKIYENQFYRKKLMIPNS
ncbi:ribosome biogenesis GTP-binding protein YihA/YsxC [Blattabacterium cuenoti]|uniref:ribosome biogenesis GTP-binding protein YihA/YsxC n=1 Tax=Blattabacterium cuenoti TaxID=1653831 RepID=UPI00163CEAD5|nr:ribosome biogenesis GTP-binding protein YihA/YsxC [Blattabacterium cuenoti]